MHSDFGKLFLLMILGVVFAEVLCATRSCYPSQNTEEEAEGDEELSKYETIFVEEYLKKYNKKLKGVKCENSPYKTFNRLNNNGHIPLSCGRCLVHEVNVKAIAAQKCEGLTPQLLIGKTNCAFKNECKLEYTPSFLFMNTKEPSCFLQVPKSLQVSYSCVDPETHPVEDVIQEAQHTAVRGLVRSHDRDVRAQYPVGAMTTKRNIIEISAPTAENGPHFVLLQAIKGKLAKGDVLTTKDGCDDCNFTWDFEELQDTHNVTGQELLFDFEISPSSPGADGFDICFQWFTFDQRDALKIFEDTLKQCRKSKIKDLPVFHVVKPITSNHERGIIRSHPQFPWNYQLPRRLLGRCDIHGLGTPPASWVSTYRKLVAVGIKTKIRVWIKQLSLFKGDTLSFITDDGQQQKDVAKGRPYNFTTRELTVNFTVKDTHRGTSNGFEICYQWYSTEREVRHDLCQDFSLKVDICKKRLKKQLPRQCRPSKSGKGRKKANKKKKGKKGKKGGKREKRERKKAKRAEKQRKEAKNGVKREA
ncbi:uncharacterized protein LOC101863404 [Aplysia californica]|uniref:Uncharacterized protein LOC101863404 n=1 Tax=Aplysia californica TaxID=6500 RepID=A0ABM1AA46_APLCA|nr:uncharacterized protein LOC101863404 [Aplysia californica]